MRRRKGGWEVRFVLPSAAGLTVYDKDGEVLGTTVPEQPKIALWCDENTEGWKQLSRDTYWFPDETSATLALLRFKR
jgi:hypothetical protein